MNYLRFDYEVEPKIMGVKDGTGQSYFSKEFWLKHPLLKEYMWGKDITDYRLGIPPRNFDLNLYELDLDKNSKLTDFVEVGLLRGCVVSNRLRSILEKANLSKHNYYPVTFKQLDKKTKEFKIIEGYWWLFFQTETGENTVNFEKSKFDFTYHIKHLNVKQSEITIRNYQDYMDFIMKTQKAPTAELLVFNKNFNRELDLWGCNYLSVKNYISERLIKILDEDKITGCHPRRLNGGPFPCELIFE